VCCKRSTAPDFLPNLIKMPESQKVASTEPSADPAQEIIAKKAAAAELNGNEVKNGDHNPSADDKEDTNDAVEGEGEDDEAVEGEDDEDAAESPEAAQSEVEKNGKQSRKRVSDVNGHDEEETEANGEQPEAKKTRQEVEDAEEDESANIVEAGGDE